MSDDAALVPGAPDVRRLASGRYLVTAAGLSSVAYAVATPDASWVFLNGRVFKIDVSPQETRRRSSDDQLALAAPMPATVIAINVEPGQRVTKGTILILLEAMKMELPIVAERDGVVDRLACQVGELVQPGVALVELQ